MNAVMLRGALLVGLAMLPGAARAGAFARCDPEPTVASEVAAADVVIIAEVVRPTVKLRDGVLRTHVYVAEVRKGVLAGRTADVFGCTGWKCGGAGRTFKKGERVLFLLSRDPANGRLRVSEKSCSGGTQLSAETFDPTVPEIAEVLTLTGPAAMVTVARDLQLDRAEVSRATYRACEAAGACTAPWCDWSTFANTTATCISPVQAAAVCAWQGKRLPTAAEWKRAARANVSVTDDPAVLEYIREGRRYTTRPGYSADELTRPAGSFTWPPRESEYDWPSLGARCAR